MFLTIVDLQDHLRLYCFALISRNITIVFKKNVAINKKGRRQGHPLDKEDLLNKCFNGP